jgi:uncharacterized membrane protein
MSEEHDGPTRYEREGSGLEFDRVAFFSDAVYAIAMTLLVVGVGVPHVRDDDLGRALSHLDTQIISFFIGFFVLGYYWLSHHALVSRLAAVNTLFMAVNLLYLAVVAFLPFLVAVAGDHRGLPLAFVLFAIALATVSFLEVVLYLIATYHDLGKERPTPGQHRHDILAGLLPGVFFLLSLPVAFVDITLAYLVWVLTFPAEILLDRVVRDERRA